MIRIQEALAGDEDAIAEVWATYVLPAQRIVYGASWGIDDPDRVATDGLWTALDVLRSEGHPDPSEDHVLDVVVKETGLALLRAEAIAASERAIAELREVSHGTITNAELRMALLLRTTGTLKQIQRAFGITRVEATRRRRTLRRKLRVWIRDAEAPQHFGDTGCRRYLAELAPGVIPTPADPDPAHPCDLCLAALSARVEMLMRYRLDRPALDANASLWNAISAHPVLSAAIAVLIAAPELALAIR